jgi:hypothetical protein
MEVCMIETEEQRRWWFATHPEYSWSRKGARKDSEQDGKSAKTDAESVDAWADEALKYERDPVVIELVNQAKFWFGTAFASKPPEEQQALLLVGEGSDRPDWEVEAQTGNFSGTGRPEDDPSYWRGYYDARRMIWNKEELPPSDPDDYSPYALGFGRGVVEAYRDAEASAKLWQVFENTWDTLFGWLPFASGALTNPSRTLARNLEKAGNPRPLDHDAHHIVPVRDGRFPEAVEARKILEKFKIDINEAVNGVWLPNKPGIGSAAYHRAIKPSEYYRKVWASLDKAKNREEAIRILDKIGRKLSNNTLFR